MLKTKIAIIGGGIAGASTALYLSQRGLEVTLFEKESSLVSGPPFCHLHAGGNLYREISDDQCLKLLKQSIDFLRFYPFVVDYRPTVIAIPTTDKGSPTALLPRLERLKKEYAALIKRDKDNEVLGASSDYYTLYERAEIEALRVQDTVSSPKTADEWMIPVAKNIALNNVQFPLILVQEYGLNLFRLAAGAMLALEKSPSVCVHQQTLVENIEKHAKFYTITYKKNSEHYHENFNYIINATGFRTGKIDDMLKAPCKQMVEFKAAYVAQWSGSEDTLFPEIIFHGERGTPQGMAQFTPYPDGHFQLHGMTEEITLYKNGRVSNTALSCQPKLGKAFIQKIEQSWSSSETEKRTHAAIDHLARFIPSFSTATVASKPLFGAQQIPGNDPTLRVTEVSFPLERYAKCEIVKVSSVIDMINAIVNEFVRLGYIDKAHQEEITLKHLKNISETDITKYAQEIAMERGYPSSLGRINVAK